MNQKEWNKFIKDVLIPLYEDRPYCENCGSTFALSFHHLIRRSRGGENNTYNIMLLCGECHHKADNASKYKEFNAMLIQKAGLRSYENKLYFINKDVWKE